MKKLFFIALIVIIALVGYRMYEQHKANKPQIIEDKILIVADDGEEEAIIYNISNEDISEEDIEEIMDEYDDNIEEEHPDLTKDEGETIVSE
jgi:predicted negative regulator of RcsB-dependent stress response